MQKDLLEPKYGLITTISMVVGSVIGVGIFLRAPQMALASGGNTTAILVAWLVSIIMVIPIVIIVSETASTLNESGGLQILGEKTWGKRTGFAMGWTQTFFYIPTNIVIILYLAADYVCNVIGIHNPSQEMILIIAILLGVVLFVINLSSPKLGGYVQIIATFVKVIPLILIAILGFMYHGDMLSNLGLDNNLNDALNNNLSKSFIEQVAAVLPMALFSLEGWIFLCVITKEVKNPSKNIPISSIGGMLLVAALYVLFTMGSFQVATPGALATNGANLIDIANLLLGKFFASIINAFVLISAFGVANGNVLALIRAPYSLSKSRTFFGSKYLERITKKNNVPMYAGILSMILVALYFIIPYMLYKSEGGTVYSMLIDCAVMIFFVYYAMICVGTVKLRYQNTKPKKGFKAPFIWGLLIVALAGCFYALFGLIVSYSNNLMATVIFAIANLSGFVLYSLTTNKQ